MDFSDLVDIKENSIYNVDEQLLEILLKDMTTGKNIFWATDNYSSRGMGYKTWDRIRIELITGRYGNVIKPRTKKSKGDQEKRIRDKAEVFTPAWICNKQNNLIDSIWFNKENVFNKEKKDGGWTTTKKKISFPEDKTWQDYIQDIRLEISCGEAPYLVSRYDTVTGDIIPVMNRIGLLDRKMRIVNENCDDKDEWIKWTIEAFKSIYAYEWQGDSLLIARENLLYTFTDNYLYKFSEKPGIELIKKIAVIISWNIWQMDGIRGVVPNSCKNERIVNYTLFGDEIIETVCKGCKKGNINYHNGIYCKIMNWKTNRKIKYVSLFRY